jgi:PAS domain S-box-containing protein
LSHLADSRSAAARSAPLHELTERRLEAELFSELAQSINSSLNLETVLRRVAQGAEDLCHGDLAEIALWDASTETMVLRYWAPPLPPKYGDLRIEPGKGMGGRVMVTGRPFRTDDYANDPRITKDYLPDALMVEVVCQLVVPIEAGDRMGGLLYVSRRTRQPFTDADEALLLRLASHAGIAITNARLYEEAEQRRREAQELVRIARSLTETLDIETLGERIVESLLSLFGVRSSALRLIEPDGSLRGIAWAGAARQHFAAGHTLPPGMGVVGRAVTEGRPVSTSDIRRDPTVILSADMRRVNALVGTEAVLAVPLRVGSKVLGVLSILDAAARVFTDAEVTLLQAFADQAAVSLDNSQLLAGLVDAEREIRARVRQQEAIAQLGQVALSGIDADTLMAQAVAFVALTLDVDLCQILELSPDGQHLVLRHGVGWKPGCVGSLTVAVDTTSHAGYTLLSDEPVMFEDLGGEEPFNGSPHLRDHGVVSGLTVAIRSTNRPVGILGVHTTRRRSFTRDDAAFLQAAANILGTAIARKAMEAALRESEARFRAAFEQSGIGRALQAFDGRYLRVNAALCRIVGHSEEELLQMTWQAITHPDDVVATAEGDAELLSGARDSYVLEKRYRHKGGHTVWASLTASVVRDATGRPLYFLGEIEDISPRRRADEALRQHADRLQTLHEIDRGIILTESPETIAQAAVRRMRQLIPCARIDLILFDFDADEAIVLAVDAAGSHDAAAGARLPVEGFDLASMETATIRTWDEAGSPFPSPPWTPAERRLGVGSCLAVPLLFGGHLIGTLELWAEGPDSFLAEQALIAQEVANSLAIAIQESRLFSQVRIGHERLRDLSRRLVEAQETERRHIARELHDEIGQVLTGLKLTLEASGRRLSGPRAASLDEARRHVNDLITRVRELSLDLRPAMLDDLGLLSALLWHFERYTHVTGVRVHVEHSGIDRRFDPELETGAYRITQEALTNVARHAGARDATVRIWADEHVLRLEVTDRGAGFDRIAADLRQSSGLTGMRERVALLGGRVMIESSPGSGTRVFAELPLA